MQISNLETFIAVSKTLNFSKAAEMLYVTQSTVSSRIKSLEDELKVVLIERNKQNVSLTPVGEHFLVQATEICRLYKNAEEDALMYDRYSGRISICAPESVWRHSFNSVISEFQRRHSNVALKLASGHSEFVIQDLLNKNVDLGIIFYRVMSDEIETIPYCSSTFHLVATPELAKTIEAPVTPENLFSHSFIYCDWGPPFEKWYVQYYKHRSHFCEIDGTSLFIDYLLSGNGLGFLPSRISKKYIDSGKLVDIPYMHSLQAPIDQSFLIFLPQNYEKVKAIVDIALQQKELYNL